MWQSSIVILLFFITFSLHGHCLAVGDTKPAGSQGTLGRDIKPQPIPGQQKPLGGCGGGNGDGREESRAEHILRDLDRNTIGCMDTQNVTMHVGDQSVVYYDGRVQALPNVEPTVWTLRQIPYHPGLFRVDHYDPFGQVISWSTSENEIQVSKARMNAFKVRYGHHASDSDIPAIIASSDDRCISFDQEGVAQLPDLSYCDPISLRAAHPVQWQNPTEGAGCTSTEIQKLLDELQHNYNTQDLHLNWESSGNILADGIAWGVCNGAMLLAPDSTFSAGCQAEGY